VRALSFGRSSQPPPPSAIDNRRRPSATKRWAHRRSPEARTPARTLGIFALWAALIGYVAVGAPGRDEAAQALDADLLAKLIANPFDPSCPPLFTVLFNFMGIWPAAYAGVLLPGAAKQTPVPAAPFVLGARRAVAPRRARARARCPVVASARPRVTPPRPTWHGALIEACG
jgi:hypothetical protein